MRLIDVDALIDALVKKTGLKWEDLCILFPICEIINNAPIIYTGPQMAKWIDNGDPLTLTCGNCGYDVMRYNNTPFCPNCGAHMKGE